MNVCCSYCRITGKSRNLPKPHYPPLIPLPKPNIEELRRKYCRITGHKSDSHSYIPTIDNDSKIPRARICRIMHKSHSMENHSYIPMFEDVAFSHLESCRITQHYARSGYNFLYPLIAIEDCKKLSEIELNQLQCCITHSHHITSNYKYSRPVIDTPEKQNVFNELHKKITMNSSPLNDEYSYVYPVLNEECSVIVSSQFEEILLSPEIEGMMMSKKGDEMIIITRGGESFSFSMQMLTAEEVHEEIANAKLLPGFGAGGNFLRQNNEEIIIHKPKAKMRKHYTLDLSEIQHSIIKQEPLHHSFHSEKITHAGSCCEKSKTMNYSSVSFVPQEALSQMSDEELECIAAELLSIFLQNKGWELIESKLSNDLKSVKAPRRKKSAVVNKGKLKSDDSRQGLSLKQNANKKRGKLTKEKAICEENDSGCSNITKKNISKTDNNKMLNAVSNNTEIKKDVKCNESTFNGTDTLSKIDTLSCSETSLIDLIASLGAANFCAVNDKREHYFLEYREVKEVLLDLVACVIPKNELLAFTEEKLNNGTLIEKIQINRANIRDAIAQSNNFARKKSLESDDKLFDSNEYKDKNEVNDEYVHKVLISFVDNLMTAVVTNEPLFQNGNDLIHSVSPKLFHLFEKVNVPEKFLKRGKLIKKELTSSPMTGSDNNMELKQIDTSQAFTREKNVNDVYPFIPSQHHMPEKVHLENARMILADLMQQLTMVATDNSATDFVQNLALQLAPIQTILTQASVNDTNSYQKIFQNLVQVLSSSIAPLASNAAEERTSLKWQIENEDNSRDQLLKLVQQHLVSLDYYICEALKLQDQGENSSISFGNQNSNMDKISISSSYEERITNVSCSVELEQDGHKTVSVTIKEMAKLQQPILGGGLTFIGGPDWEEIRAAQEGFDFSLFETAEKKIESANSTSDTNADSSISPSVLKKLVYKCIPGQIAIPVLNESIIDEAEMQPELIIKQTEEKYEAEASLEICSPKFPKSKTTIIPSSAVVSSQPIHLEEGIEFVPSRLTEISEAKSVSCIHPDDLTDLNFFNIPENEVIMSSSKELKEGFELEELDEHTERAKELSDSVTQAEFSSKPNKQISTFSVPIGYISTKKGPQTVTVQQIETQNGQRIIPLEQIHTKNGSHMVAVGQIYTPDGPKGIALGQIQTHDGPKIVALGQIRTPHGLKLVALGHIESDDLQLLALQQMHTEEGTHVVAVQQVRFQELSGVVDFVQDGKKLETINMTQVNTDSGSEIINIGHIQTSNGSRTLALGQMETPMGPKIITVGQIETKNGLKTVAIGQILTESGLQTMALGQIQTKDGPRMVGLGQIQTSDGPKLVALAQIRTNQGLKMMAIGHIQTAEGAKLIALSHTKTKDGIKMVAVKEIDPSELPQIADYSKNLEHFSRSLEHETNIELRTNPEKKFEESQITVSNPKNPNNPLPEQHPDIQDEHQENFAILTQLLGARAPQEGVQLAFEKDDPSKNSLIIGQFVDTDNGVRFALGRVEQTTQGLTFEMVNSDDALLSATAVIPLQAVDVGERRKLVLAKLNLSGSVMQTESFSVKQKSLFSSSEMITSYFEEEEEEEEEEGESMYTEEVLELPSIEKMSKKRSFKRNSKGKKSVAFETEPPSMKKYRSTFTRKGSIPSGGLLSSNINEFFTEYDASVMEEKVPISEENIAILSFAIYEAATKGELNLAESLKSEIVQSEISREKMPNQFEKIHEQKNIESKVFDLYVAIADYIPDDSDSEAIPVLEGQIVEVLDSHSSQKWLVRTRPTKTSSSKQGWVPPSYLEKKTLSSTLRNIQEILEMESDSSSDGRMREATRKRSQIVKELVETEEEFSKDMVHVVNTYLRDLENPRVPKEIRDLRDSIFMNFKQICDFHNNVLIKGVQYYANEPIKLGKTFLRLERDFDMHVNYCRDEPQAQIILASSPAKEYFEQYSQRIGEVDKTLSDHLKLPIQRINDYQLLLKELIKYSARLKEDCVDLQKALDFMLSIPQRAHDIKFINSIEGYKGNLLKLGRLLRHDWFTITDNEGKSKERYLFLFKSRILITKVRRINEERSVFILKDIIRLPDTEIKDLSGDKHKFELHHKQKEFPRYPLTLSAKTEFIKEAWLKEIREFANDLAAAVDLGIEEIEITPVSLSFEETPLNVPGELKILTDTVHSESVSSMDGLEVPTEEQRPSTPGGTILPHPPIFAIKFKDTEIIEGSTVTFMLKIHALPDAEIKFYKDDKEIQFDERVKLIVEDKETFELVIINVVPKDAGKYRCTAKNSEGEASEEANVTISADKKVFIGIDDVAKTPSPIPLQPGESPDFKWYRDGQEFEASERFKVMFKDEEDTLALVFQHVKPEDAGLYTCVASTASGNISCSAELTVQGAVHQLLREPEAPKVTAELADTEVSAGGSAMLELKYSGYPKPSISWVKDKTEIQAGGRFRFLHEDDESVALIIKNVEAEDSGKYKVIVKNELGESTTSADLIVKAPPKFKKQMKDLSVMTEETIKFEVEIEGKPTPEITWYKDGQVISASSKIEIRHEKEETYSLIIKKVISEDSGSYSCVASNSSGKISEFSNLSVNVPPTFLKELKSVECKETDTVKFEVKVAGTPIPKVTWTKDGEEIKADGKRIKTEQDDRNYSLTIEKVTRTDTASYSCTITNEHGSASSSGKLAVNCIPEFTHRLSDKTLKEGDEDVKFEVKLSGTPTPKIRWFIESMEITEKSNNYTVKDEGETQVLIIKKVTPDCSGKLTCQATNSIGEVKTAATISVLTKPKFTQSLSDKEVTEGDAVSFTVKISANPGPEVKWFKNNKELNVDAHIKFTHDSSETWSVSFDCIKGPDAGDYECRATNSEGKSSSTSKLIVNTKPKFEKGLTDINAWLGLEADIEVKVEGIPDPEVKWFKNDQLLSSSERVKFEKIEKTHSIVIKETVLEDASSYKCTIKNKIGEASTECTLKIKTPEDAKEPVCIKNLKDTITVRGEPTVFEAKILGNPKPEVKWMKDGVELAEGGLIHITEKTEEYLYRLTVEKSVSEDMGIYKIHASNEHGQISSEATLDVHVLPEITPPMDRKIMPKGKAIFEATVTGRPQPKVSWYKNGKPLVEGKVFQWNAEDAKNLYTLTVDGADLEDAGEYECVAENVVGKVKQPFNLLITTEEPSFTKPLHSAFIKPTTKAQFDVEVSGIPIPGVKWLRGGVELSPNFKTQIIQNSETSHTLNIDPFSEEDVGEYECKAISAAGEASSKARLDVKHELPFFPKHVPKETCAIDGESFTLEAKVDGSPHPKVKWLKDGKELVPGDRFKMEELPDGTVRLTVSNAKSSDTGKYTLVATNESGELSSSGLVKVEAVPKAPSIPEKLQKTEVLVGSPLMLKARVTGHPRPIIKWLKDGKPIKADRVKLAEQPDGCVALIIDEARPEDAGKYSLIVKNNLGETSSEADVIVSSAPSSPGFHIKLKHTDVYEGYPLTLEGKVIGYPLPILQWLKDGQEIKPDGERIISTIRPDGSFSLIVNDSAPSDAGKYTCVATNSEGTEQSEAEVDVKSRTKPGEPLCSPSFITPLRDTGLDEGLPLKLQAHITGNPVPSISWYKDGEALKPSDRIRIFFDGDRVSLDVKNVTPADAGKYECKLTSSEGTVSSIADVKVKKVSKPPVFTQRFPDSVVILAQDGRFVCRVSGIPTPDITWYFNNNPLSESDKYKMKHEGDMYALYVKDCTNKDIGNITCTARNIDGEENCVAFLNIVDKLDQKPKIEAPSFLKKLADCEIIEGMTAKFTACITGYPEPDFKWFKDGHELTQTERIHFEVEPHGLLRLLIKNVRADDVGKYSLKISNPHGSAESEASMNYEDYERKPKRPMADLNIEYEKVKKTGVPFALPDKPIISKMTDRRLTLSWKPSLPIGPRLPVTYIVEMCEVPDDNWYSSRTGVRGCCCEIRNLEPFRDYKFRIRVENKYGISDPSPYATAYRTKLEMSPPKFLPSLPPEFDFRPETSPYFPKDYDIEKPLHEAYAHAPRFLRQETDTQYGVRNQPSNIQWFVYGYPVPTISWYFEDEKIEVLNRYSSSFSRNGQATLYINRFLERDVGIYECVAVNEHGEARQRIVMNIAEPPVFSKQLDEETIMIRDTACFECRVVGIPYPQIKWYKDWHPLASSNRIKIEWKEPDLCILTIHDTISKDAGLYSCSACNLAGMASNSVMLTIEENEADYAILSYSHSKVVKARRKPFEDFYDIGDELGRGTQGIIYHAVERATGNSYAGKIMHGKGDIRDAMNHELNIMNQLHDRHLIRGIDCFETKQGLTLITELASGGELLDSLCKQSTLSEDEVAMYIRQVLWGLEHMHNKGIAHLGLTPGDLLLAKPGGDDIKICDFGLAHRIVREKAHFLDYGMPEFVAPEIANKQPVSLSADMWSVGVITYLLLSGISPFLGEHDRQTLQQVQQGRINFDPEVFSAISDEAKDFISKLLVFDSSGRLDVKQALKHPWLKWADRPGSGERFNIDRLKNYYRRYKDWVSNSACKRFYRRRPLSSAFTHPSRMVYPPDEQYTPPSSPEMSPTVRSKPPPWDMPKFEDKVDREEINYDLGYIDSESRYQSGPDTYLLQLRDVGLPLRLREYMRVAGSQSPTLGVRLLDTLLGKSVTIRERRRFTDVMDEEIDDERKGCTDSTQRRIISEVSPRSETKNRIKELLPTKAEDGSIPFFREKLHDESFVEEQEVELSCFAVGDPKPTVQWYRNDVILQKTHRLSFEETPEGHSVLHFTSTKAFDAGLYKAIARNANGDAVCRARLRLGDVPGRMDAPEISKVSDSEAFVTWASPKDTGNSTIQSYELEYKDAVSSDWLSAHTEIPHEFFMIRGLKPTTQYQCRVRAKNKFGIGEFSVPSAAVRTLEEGSEKVSISRAMKHQQELTESGSVSEFRPRGGLDYSVEDNPINVTGGSPSDKYNFVSEIARGRFSVVYKCCQQGGDRVFASKIIDSSAANIEQARHEFEIMRTLCHERLPCLYEVFSHDGTQVLVMEKLQGYNILTYLSHRHEYSEEMVTKIISQVLDALQYLHFRSLMHLDIQPDNVVMKDLRTNEIKLIDFGSAKKLPRFGSIFITDKPGLLDYRAPEITNNEEVSAQADIWSVGVLAYVLLSGTAPFTGNDDKETTENINFVRYRFENLFKEITPESTRFLLQIFKRTPAKRPIADECLEHKWLNPSEYMLKKRERAIFLSSRLKQYADIYHNKKQELSKASESLAASLGIQVGRSISVECDTSTTF